MITIVDYGLGNLGSIKNMFNRLGIPSLITSDIDQISSASKILLPGVGSFDNAMSRINHGSLRKVLDLKALEECIPIMGICLGMQLLTNGSEEGSLPGLGWVPSKAVRIPAQQGLKVPHMGWNKVLPTSRSKLTENLPNNARFYFVHSYCVKVEHTKYSILKTNHGIDFDAAIQNNNIFGVQFHPEKSHKFGMQILQTFADI